MAIPCSQEKKTDPKVRKNAVKDKKDKKDKDGEDNQKDTPEEKARKEHQQLVKDAKKVRLKLIICSKDRLVTFKLHSNSGDIRQSMMQAAKSRLPLDCIPISFHCLLLKQALCVRSVEACFSCTHMNVRMHICI